MAAPPPRFVLFIIQEGELRGQHAYNLFEPDVVFEVNGRNAFEPFGRRRLRVVIMASREVWLRETADLVRHVDRGITQWEYHYPLCGTQNDIYVVPSDGDLKIFVDWQDQGQRPIGKATVREWVRTIAVVSRELSDLFRRYQPSLLKESLGTQERLLQDIESWLVAHEDA